MFTMDEMLSKKNQRLALEHLASKRDGCGIDGMHVSELEEYWRLNGDQISKKLKNQKYQSGIILIREIVNKNGKRRNIASLNAIDRFITRLLAQKLNRYISPIFLENSFAYQDGKGVLSAVMKAKEYIEVGKKYVAEIDLKNYFDTIPFDRMISKIEEQISDAAVLYLIKQYLFCSLSFEGRISKKTEGLVQGNAMSPILSNLYLQTFDEMLTEKEVCWIRYADNIYLYADSHEEAVNTYHIAIEYLEENLKLKVNREKSGIFEADSRSILGYDIIKKNNVVDVRKHVYREVNQYANWHDSRSVII